MSKKYNWGIIGLGNIAHKFAHDIQLVEDATLYGVASRNIEKARKFGQTYNSTKCYGSYKELLNDSHIDVVYIATPHAYHCELALEAMDAGKAVLCEKPFGMNRVEVEKLIAKSKEKKVFLMEALWTRFIPATEKLLSLLKSDIIGDLKSVRADFGFKAVFEPEKRLFKKELGGGALLDIGIYPIFISLLTLGVPTEIKALATMFPSNVDSSCSMIFGYDSDQSAVLDANLLANTPIVCWLHGTKGSLKMSNPFHSTKEISFFKDRELVETYNLEYTGLGYYHEILDVQESLKQNKLESEKLPLSFSLELISIMDKVREEIDLNY